MKILSTYALPIYLSICVGVSFYFIPDNVILQNQRYDSIVSQPDIYVDNQKLVYVNSQEEQSKIFYTLDGSLPDARSNEFSQSFQLFQTHLNRDILLKQESPIDRRGLVDGFPIEAYVLRAVSHLPKLGFSQPSFKTYLVKNESKQLRILSLAIDKTFFFDECFGRLTMGMPFWNQKKLNLGLPWWEWPANYKEEGFQTEGYGAMELMGIDGETISTENIKIQIHGNASRAFPQKSFRLEGDAYYGSGHINFGFNQTGTNEHSSLILRNSGNDWGLSMFADAFMQEAISDMNLLTQQSEPVHLLLNGIYWGIYNVRNRYDTEFLENFGDQKAGRLAVISGDAKLKKGKASDLRDYKKIAVLLKSNMSSDEKRVQLLEYIDFANFIDYIIAESYFANTDWPKNNLKCFRQSKKDRWKWMVYDLDYGLSYIGNPAAYEVNQFERLYESTGITALIFKFILSNDNLKDKFVSRYKQLLKENLSQATLLPLLASFEEKYQEDVYFQSARWRKPRSIHDWQAVVDQFRVFIKLREKHILKQLEQL